MTQPNEFFLIFFLTIIAVRVFLFLKPIPSPTVEGFRVHHYMYGVVLVVIGLLVHSIVVYAIGFGLFIDELTYLLIGGKTHTDNYSVKSLVGTGICIILVFIFREYLIPPF